MTKIVKHTTAFLLILAILSGYAGIPLSKMICREDGHTTFALSNAGNGCEHDTQAAEKDCCKPAKQTNKPAPSEGCCDFDHSFFKIYTNTLVQQVKDKTGHYLPVFTHLFASAETNLLEQANQQFHSAVFAPPDNRLVSTPHSFLQVFRI